MHLTGVPGRDKTMENMWGKQMEDIISENFLELKTDISLYNENFKILTTQGKKFSLG